MVSEKELLKQAREAEKALEKETERSSNSPLILIMALALALLIILMVVPGHYLKLDKEPRNVPTLAEIQQLIPASEFNKTLKTDNSFLSSLNPSDQTVKKVANKIVASSCAGSGEVCHAKALFYFVRDNINYVSDPPDEYLENPVETLITGGADCDGQAILLANLLQATGFYSRFVLIPQHSYVQILIPSASSRYKDSGNWINLDPTCRDCDFGEIPRQNKDKAKRYV